MVTIFDKPLSEIDRIRIKHIRQTIKDFDRAIQDIY